MNFERDLDIDIHGEKFQISENIVLAYQAQTIGNADLAKLFSVFTHVTFSPVGLK